MTRHHVYWNHRPRLVVENRGGKALGNCYIASFQRITSTLRMSRKEIEALRDAGVLHGGQEFYIRSQCDGNEPAAGQDMLPCVVELNGEILDEPAINPYSGLPYAPIQQSYFVYETESRVDSGD